VLRGHCGTLAQGGVRRPIASVPPDAWEEGSVGWAAVKETVSVDGRALEARATYVLRLEHGEWKVVQAHWSLPQAKIEAFGRPLTVTIEELEKIVQSERPDISSTVDTDGTKTATSSARRFTMQRALRVKPLAARFSCRASSTTSSLLPASTFTRAARWN
jgi:SnoaL-like domain